jgi:hypothetical protein
VKVTEELQLFEAVPRALAGAAPRSVPPTANAPTRIIIDARLHFEPVVLIMRFPSVLGAGSAE